MITQVNELERLTAERRRILLWAIVGGVLFLGGILAQSAFPQLDRTPWFAPLFLLCSVPFMVTSILLTRWIWKAYRNPSLWKALNDERIEENRRRGWTAGYWAMYILQAGWIGVFSVKPHLVAPLVVALANIFVGFTVGLVVFFRHEEMPSGRTERES